MTRSLFYLGVPVFLGLPAWAAAPNIFTLGQGDQLNIQCAPFTTTMSSRVTVTQTVTSTVTVSSCIYTSTSGTTTSTRSTKTSSASQTPLPTLAGPFRNALYLYNDFAAKANYTPSDLPVDKITHVLYSFAKIKENGIVTSSNHTLDIRQRFPTDKTNEPGRNVYGYVKQLYELKKKNRNLKVLLSIGGGDADGTHTIQDRFRDVAANSTKRGTFATTAAELIGNWGFDGIDIDWESPTNDTEAKNYVDLLKECRAALDQYAKNHSIQYHFLISVAVPGDFYDAGILDLHGMKPFVDIWNVMTYDFINDPNGTYKSDTSYSTNLYMDPQNEAATPESTDNTVETVYLKGGIDPASISIGLPLYANLFYNTVLPVGSPFVNKGTLAYNKLPSTGLTVEYDNVSVSSYSYDNQAHALYSYDTPKTAVLKADYLRSLGLGGAFFFEATEDKPGSESLVAAVAGELGHLDMSQNLLNYPGSKYANIRNNLPGEE